MSTAASGSILLHNILLFGRLLRGLGLDVNPNRMMDLVQALDFIDLSRREDFYFAARGLLVHAHDDIPLFDQAFDLFWQAPAQRRLVFELATQIRKQKTPAPRRARQSLPQRGRPAAPAEQNGREDDEPPSLDLTQTYSAREMLQKRISLT